MKPRPSWSRDAATRKAERIAQRESEMFLKHKLDPDFQVEAFMDRVYATHGKLVATMVLGIVLVELADGAFMARIDENGELSFWSEDEPPTARKEWQA